MWLVFPAMRPRPARLSVPSLRLYCQMPGTGPSRAVRDMWTVPADKVAQAVTVTVTVAPSTRVLTGPPGERAGPGGRGRAGARLRRPGRRIRVAGGRRRWRTG